MSEEQLEVNDILVTLKDVRDVLARLKQGQDELMEVIYPRYARMFHAAAMRRGFSWDETEEVIGETFRRVIQGLGTYNDKSGGSKWMWAIFRNTCTDLLRGKHQTDSLPEDDEQFASEEDDPLEKLLKVEGNESERRKMLAVQAAWDALSEAEREALRGGRGPGRGRTGWHNAVRHMKTLLKDYF